MGQQGKLAAKVGIAAQLQVVLLAQPQMAGNAALHQQPRDDDRAVIADHFMELSLLTGEECRAGERAGADQFFHHMTDGLTPDDVHKDQRPQKDYNAHRAVSVGADTCSSSCCRKWTLSV